MIVSTSSGRTFGGLARYLVVGRSGVEVDRVDWATSRNLPTDDPELAARLMEATADQSVRVQKPVYHVSLSFDPTDQVRRPQVEQVADRLLRALELQEHQALLVAHRDREHAHVHIVVNRVHPDTGRAWERWQDRPRIEKDHCVPRASTVPWRDRTARCSPIACVSWRPSCEPPSHGQN